MQDEVRNKPPVKVFACGVVKAAIWADSRVIDNEVVEMHSIKFDRSYKDKDSGEWKHTQSFDVDSLPKLAVVAMETFRWLRVRAYGEEHQSDGDTPSVGG